MKLTKWYPKKITPARVGVYEILVGDNKLHKLSYWDGEHWSWFGTTMKDVMAYMLHDDLWHISLFKWRGLSSPDAASSEGSK